MAVTPSFTSRIATEADTPVLHAVMTRAIEQLQGDFLSPAQVAASHQVMGLDTQLILDGTYFVLESLCLDGAVRVAGCGGWSFRSTLFGGDASMVARIPELLDPAQDAAKVRAMYTDPDFARRGVGRMLLTLCENAARAAGFQRAELMATAAGFPLYHSCGYVAVAGMHDYPVGDVTVPLLRMEKPLHRP